MTSDEAVDDAVAALRRGGLVAFPTDTVYAVGVEADSDDAVRRLRAAAGPTGGALDVHLSPLADFSDWAVWDERAHAVAHRFWPGPLTLILRRTGRVSALVAGDGPTVRLGVPSHPLAVALLHRFDGAVAATSASPAGEPRPTTAEQVRAGLGDAVDLVLDGGVGPEGIHSTVLSLAEEVPRVLRVGAAPVEALVALLGDVVLPADG